MPKYKWTIDALLFEEDVKKVYDKCRTSYERMLISICWLTGARTNEILGLVKEDIGFNTEKLDIRMPTLKLKKKGGPDDFKVNHRVLSFSRPLGTQMNLYVETIIKNVQELKPGEKLLPYTDRWAEKITGGRGEEAIGKWLTPYHFRHSCLTWLGYHGYSLTELMHFKGAISPLSVSMYIKAKPHVIKMENLKREKAFEQKEAVISQPTSVNAAAMETSPTQEASV